MRIPFAVMVLFVSSLGWGLTWLPIKTLTDMGLHSMHLVLIAFVSGSLVLLPALIRQYRYWKPFVGILLLVALAGGIANASFQTAMSHGHVVRVMILFYLLPVWSVIGGYLLLGEKLDRIRLLAVVLCLAGAFLILDVWHNAWHGVTWIDLLGVLSGMGLAATNILFRYSQQVPVTSKVAAMFIGCSGIIGLSLLIFPPQASLPEGGAVAYAILYGAVWLTLITFGTQWGVTQMEAGRSAVIIVMELLAAVISVALLTHSELQPHELFGGLMVLGAALLEGMRSEPTPQPALAQGRAD